MKIERTAQHRTARNHRVIARVAALGLGVMGCTAPDLLNTNIAHTGSSAPMDAASWKTGQFKLTDASLAGIRAKMGGLLSTDPDSPAFKLLLNRAGPACAAATMNQQVCLEYNWVGAFPPVDDIATPDNFAFSSTLLKTVGKDPIPLVKTVAETGLDQLLNLSTGDTLAMELTLNDPLSNVGIHVGSAFRPDEKVPGTYFGSTMEFDPPLTKDFECICNSVDPHPKPLPQNGCKDLCVTFFEQLPFGTGKDCRVFLRARLRRVGLEFGFFQVKPGFSPNPWTKGQWTSHLFEGAKDFHADGLFDLVLDVVGAKTLSDSVSVKESQARSTPIPAATSLSGRTASSAASSASSPIATARSPEQWAPSMRLESRKQSPMGSRLLPS